MGLACESGVMGPVKRFCHMDLLTLGEVRLTAGGKELLAGRRKLLAVLAYVARAGRSPVPRDRLASLFWGDRSEVRARQSLRQALSELRAAVGDVLLSSADGVTLSAGAVALDLNAFEAEVAAGAFRRALDRWQGDFLAGLEDAGTGEYRVWLEGERAAARRLFAWCCRRAVEDDLSRGEFAHAAAAAERWSEAFPADVEAHEALVRALHLDGRAVEAATAQARFSARFRDTFGHDPEPRTDVETAVSAAVPDAGRVVHPVSPDSLRQRLSAGLIGRSAALSMLDAALASASSAIAAGDLSPRGVTVWVGGGPGAGRTRLCDAFLEVASISGDAPFVLRARAFAGDDLVQWSTLRALLQGIGTAPGLAGAADQDLALVAALAPEVRDRYASLPPSPAPDPAALAAALARVCADIGSERPVVLFLDDAPLADTGTRLVCAALARRPPPGVLVLLAGRDAALRDDPILGTLDRADIARRVALPPLEVADVRRLIAAAASDPEAAWIDALAPRVHAATGGWPAQVLAHVEALAERRLLVPGRAGGWEPRLEGLPLALPAPPMRRRWTLGLAGGALVMALTLAAATVLAPAASLRQAETAAAVDRIAIFPFSVRGESRYDYLAEGLVELLTLKLDHAGDLRGTDPPAVLATMRRALENGPSDRDGGEFLEPDEARALAARLGAGRYVLGSAVEAGGRVTLRASLYERGRLRGTAEAGPAEESALFELVDTLAFQLLAGIHAAPGDRLVRLAVATSSSLTALKAYLEGEAAYRRGDYVAAAAAFQRAVAVDTSFALAHYRYAIAAEWAGEMRPGVLEAAIARALRHSSRLPDRDQRFLDAFAAYHDSRALDAEAGYRSILDMYPADVETWFALAEVLFHAGPRIARPGAMEDAAAAFRRVLESDPDHEEALLHLVRAGAALEDPAQVRSAIARLAAPGDRATGVARSARALAIFVAGTDADRAAILADLRTAPSLVVHVAAMFVAVYGHDPVAAGRVASLMTDAARPAAVRADGYLLAAALARASGRWAVADSALSDAATLAPGRVLELRALWAGDPSSPIHPEAVAVLRAALADRATGAVSVADGWHPDLGTTINHYLAGRVALRAGDTADARRWLAGLGRLHGHDTGPGLDAASLRLAAALEAGLRAAILRHEGRFHAAVSALDEVAFDTWHIYAMTSPFFALADERWLYADLLRRAGRLDEALNWYRSVPTATPWDLVHTAPARACVERILAGGYQCTS
jgi:DNA-binding SARP family transcriptional activator/tetratricopeptide (TPR) repeat protein